MWNFLPSRPYQVMSVSGKLQMELLEPVRFIVPLVWPRGMTDLSQCRKKMGRVSENPGQFAHEFQTLIMSFDPSWRGTQIVLSTCCSSEQKTQNLVSSSGTCWWWQQLNQLLWPTAVPAHDPTLNYQMGHAELVRGDDMIHSLISSMKKYIIKPINYKK